MKLSTSLYLLSTFLTTNAIKCSNHEILQNYNIIDHSASGEIDKNTPPSKTIESWWLNICEENKDNFKPSNECDKNDLLCGITQVSLPDEKNLLTTQIIEFGNRLALEIDSNDDEQTLFITIKSNKWGSFNIDANIEWKCDNNLKNDEIVDSAWFDNEITLSVKGPSACLKDGGNNNNNNKPKNGDNKKPNNDNKKEDEKKDKKSGGLSWFTWLFLYALLFTFFYLIITAYMNTRGGNLDDFRQEFVERSTQLFTSLPAFCKEVIAKIFGSRATSERGGYSAV
ncbi:autophagy-related protein 27 [Monosporozyma unispora]|nr:type II membrane protein [Kazachstania unispora]